MSGTSACSRRNRRSTRRGRDAARRRPAEGTSRRRAGGPSDSPRARDPRSGCRRSCRGCLRERNTTPAGTTERGDLVAPAVARPGAPGRRARRASSEWNARGSSSSRRPSTKTALSRISTVSPGSATARLTKSRRGSSGNLKTMTSPRRTGRQGRSRSRAAAARGAKMNLFTMTWSPTRTVFSIDGVGTTKAWKRNVRTKRAKHDRDEDRLGVLAADATGAERPRMPAAAAARVSASSADEPEHPVPSRAGEEMDRHAGELPDLGDRSVPDVRVRLGLVGPVEQRRAGRRCFRAGSSPRNGCRESCRGCLPFRSRSRAGTRNGPNWSRATRHVRHVGVARR